MKLAAAVERAGPAGGEPDDTTGTVIEYTLDNAGKIVNSRVVSQATGGGTRQ